MVDPILTAPNNYVNQNINCPLCEEELDQQRHIFTCPVIQRVKGTTNGEYEDLFSNNIDKLYSTAKELIEIVKIRDVLLDP